jgi:hypothetical protein
VRRFWRRINRVEPARGSALALLVLLLPGLVAYGVASYSTRPTAGALAAAAALLAVAATGLVYAWRLGTGGLSD